MRVEREVLRLQMLSGLVVGEIVEQDGAQNGAFGINVCRQGLREMVVSGGQGRSRRRQRCYRHARCECEVETRKTEDKLNFYGCPLAQQEVNGPKSPHSPHYR